ncbi:MAG: hypothetical protein D6691_05250 [Candidatus Hydrogenedentota bacterium]|jgi:tetratricopeptide (TPR) repeat protein|uniref:Uncharacterized protein n=1 Tax=Sumerlaea chitinivorans TaxID=2250252 RepID=A0A2Z4Y5V6_SUMC1|nr:hypothetical protein BRCON_1305 [Candidatus Sumerlaea chitinivorans]RMH27867.1 MAG: hypothetical protein D6691_05250 [Candidatus Hydrogenedentota bacterium]GIX45683.1 MAG: hypothetical protein KatS3mg130_2091 [Candidatus Sumerlaea sp.]
MTAKVVTHERKLAALTVVCLVCYALLPAFSRLIQRDEGLRLKRSEDFRAQQLRNSSAIATILGEFRTNLSDMLFIKTERYLHGGVAYMPHIDTDELARSGEVEHTQQMKDEHTTTPHVASMMPLQTHDEHTTEEELHHEPATLIRTPENDFRGFIGALEREVKPWRDPRLPHEHRGGIELLPWYRLATLVDPTNVRAYMIGAWWLKSLGKDEQLLEAIKFLDEGIESNPEAFQLYLMKGYILHALKREEEASASFRQAVELMAKQRPESGELGPKWTHYNEEDAIAACNMAILLERDLRGVKAAQKLLEDYARRFKNMPNLDRLRRTLQEEERKAQTQ